MKKVLSCFLLFATSCYLPDAGEDFYSKGLSPQRQKQKIMALQKKLETAEKEEKKAKELVEKLRSEIEEAELSFVRKGIRSMESFLARLQNDPQGAIKRAQIDVSMLFLQEREILHRLIESGPTPAALEAQGLLDQVLRIITNLSDDANPFLKY